MDIVEANKVFNVWRKWFWPCHDILSSFFGWHTIPESYLPYPKDVLYEALTMVANSNLYGESSKEDIIGTRNCLIHYVKDEAALQDFFKTMSIVTIPKMEEIMLIRLQRYKNNWGDWLEKQEK